jgi:uncharacterized protein
MTTGEVRIPIPKPALDEFCARWKVAELSLFGSATREDFSSGSDVDILVSFIPGDTWNLIDLIEMKFQLEDLFGRKVDLVEETAITNPYRLRSILRDKTPIYAA